MSTVLGLVAGLGLLLLWWELRRIHALVNSRYSKMESQLAIANQTITDLARRLDESRRPA